ncbi:hypothetical protein ABT381_29650 [Streptomyces sp. NPDC000151]|uniref:hypothetical protein n=1 Tax=Streptomyces sp. NPDC000151 TaxID=3154244 RepID=UPI00331E0836
MPVSPTGGEALHDAVLNYLYRLAMATGHPVRASVHDARSGYLTPIEVQTDGSSHFAGEPEQVAAPAVRQTTPPSAPAPVAEPRPASGGAAAPLTIPPALADAVARINDAVRLGHLEFAASTAQSALNATAQEFGVGHPYVLHLQELFAHIAYLAHDTVKAVAIYLDVFEYRRRQDDPTAYDTFMRAAKVWLSITDPQQGLAYGQQLIALWLELARPGGPAAADGDKIEAARKRMARLADRATAQGQSPA